MTQLLHQLLDRVVFAFDFETVESVAGVKYLIDRGPNGFHFAFPGGAADPTEQLDGSYSFDGGDYLSLPAAQLVRFYSKMPTGEHTWIWRGHATAATVGTFFSCWNGAANHKGIMIQQDSGGWVIRCYQLQGTAALVQARAIDAGSLNAASFGSFSMEAAPICCVRGNLMASAWSGGSIGTAVYDPAIPPRIGMNPAGAGYPLTGRLYDLALVRGAVDLPTQLETQRMLAVGRKPWCERGF